MDAVVDGEVDGAEWSLCMVTAQITDGATNCAACGRDATFVLANGADPEYVAYCADHGLDWIDSHASHMHQLFDSRRTGAVV